MLFPDLKDASNATQERNAAQTGAGCIPKVFFSTKTSHNALTRAPRLMQEAPPKQLRPLLFRQ